MTQSMMTLQSAPITLAEVFVVENNPTSPYDKCLDDVEVVLKNVVKMARICLDHHWQDTIPIFVDTLKIAQKAAQCFQHPSLEDIESKPDIKCIIEHLQKAAVVVQQIIEDITNQHWNAILEHAKELAAIIKDIKNC